MTELNQQDVVSPVLSVGPALSLTLGCLTYRRAICTAISMVCFPSVDTTVEAGIAMRIRLMRRVLVHVSNEARLYGVSPVAFADVLEKWSHRSRIGLPEFAKLERHLRKPRIRPNGHQWPEALRRMIQTIPFDQLLALLRHFDTVAAAALTKANCIVDVESTPIKKLGSKIEHTPRPWKPDDPLLELGKNGAFFGLDRVHPEDLRNVLVLGETGSGKTVSAVIPYLNAALSYRLADGRDATVFVADPKCEMRSVVEANLRCAGALERLIVLGNDSLPIRFFALDCRLSMADRRQKIEAFLPFEGFTGGDHAYWNENSMTKLYALLELQAQVAGRVPGVRLFNEWARTLGIRPCDSRNSWVLLKLILQRLCEGGSKGLKIGQQALHDTCKLYDITGPETTVLDMYVGDTEAFMQFMYIVTCAIPLLGLMTDPYLLKYVELDPVPDPHCDAIDIASLVEQGKVILIQPENKESARIAAKAVKGKVHEAVFTRQDRERPVFTVVDEFQRFVSNDPETGEQAYLDRCRGYRGMALYATQTLASLKHALGSDNAAQTAVDIMLANTPTKIVMRTTDATTLDWLRAVLPGPPLPGPHVVDVHRPIELCRGQGYFIQANGTWALRRATPAVLQPFH